MMFYDNRQFYIDGAWVDPVEPIRSSSVINPATESRSRRDIDGPGPRMSIVRWAPRGAPSTAIPAASPAERLALMERILAAYKAHYDEIAAGDFRPKWALP